MTGVLTADFLNQLPADKIHHILFLSHGRVDINVHGDLYAAVPQDLAEAFDIASKLHAAAGKGVAEHVETERRDPAFFQYGRKTVLEGTDLRPGAFSPGDQIVSGRLPAEPQKIDQPVGKRDDADGRKGFRQLYAYLRFGASCWRGVSSDSLEIPPDGKAASVQVKILPSERAKLPDPDPRVHGDQNSHARIL